MEQGGMVYLDVGGMGNLYDIGPLINLGTQHDGRSARTWMKRVLTTFVSLWEGKKDLLESTKMDFYET